MTYSIKEMSELTGLPASTLRYYDKQGLLPNLQRDSNNNRIFSDEDYGNLRLIDCLKRSGLSIKDIRSFIKLMKKGDRSLSDRLEIFTKRREAIKQEIADLQVLLTVIDYKCWYYGKACEAGTEAAVKGIDASEIPEEFREARRHLRGIKFHEIP
jgi:DNA-binding transcriptional MerR regulator